MMHNEEPHHTRSSWVFLSTLFLFIALLILLLPTLLSTSWGNRFLTKKLGEKAGGSLAIETIGLSWFSGQTLKGIAFHNEEASLTSPSVVIDSPLWSILFAHDVGTLSIHSPVLTVNQPIAFASYPLPVQWQNASFSLSAIDFSSSGNWTGNVIVDQGKLELAPEGLKPLSFDQLALEINRPDLNSLMLTCKTVTAEGSLSLKASLSEMQSAFPSMNAQLSIAQLPMKGMDQILSLFDPTFDGLLSSALGPTLNATCQLNASSGNFDINLNATSSQLNLQLATQSSHGMLSLKAPASGSLILTPQAFQRISSLFPQLRPFALNQPTTLQLTLSQFSSAMPKTLADFKQAALQMRLFASSSIPFTYLNKPMALSSFSTQISSSSLQDALTLTGAASLLSQGFTSPLSFQASLSHPFEKPLGEIKLSTTQFPVEILSSFTSPQLIRFIGSSLNANLLWQLKPEQSDIQLSLQSSLLKLSSLQLIYKDTLSLLSPAVINYTLRPDLFHLTAPAECTLTLQELQIPLNAIDATRCVASFSSPLLSTNLPLTAKNIQGKLNINSLDMIGFSLIADTLKASFNAAWKRKTEELVFNQPINLELLLNAALVQSLLSSQTTLLQPASFQLMINPFTLPVSSLSLNQLNATGQASLSQLNLSSQNKTRSLSLSNTQIPFQWDGKSNILNLQVSSTVKNDNGDSGTIQGKTTLRSLFKEGAIDPIGVEVDAAYDLKQIPSLLLESLSGQSGIASLIGQTFSSNLSIHSQGSTHALALKLSAPLLTADTSFAIDNRAIQLQGNNNQITWTITPQGYLSLDRYLTGATQTPIPFELKEPSTFNFTLSRLFFPVIANTSPQTFLDRIPTLHFDLSELQIVGLGKTNGLAFFDKSSKESLQLSSLSLSFDKANRSAPLVVNMESQIPSSSKPGNVTLSAKVTPLPKNPDGSINIARLSAELDLKAVQLPSRALDLIARVKGRTDFPFTTLFGDRLDATLSLKLKELSGPVSFNLNSPMTRASLNGQMAAGALLLNDTIHAQVRVTPEMSQLLLKEINPLSLHSFYSKDPITLEVPSQGFYLPLYPANVAKAAIPQAKIELGKIACRNEGNVNIALSLLKSKQFDKNTDMTLWFAPIDLHLKQGVVDIERTEILLADTFDIAIWGNVDIAQDYVDMLLGLTAETLRKAFSLKNLPENYVLTIPMRGKMDNVTIDTSKATAKVALLLASQTSKAAGGAAGGPAGALVGGLLNKMATLPDSNVKVPPAKHPFPWEMGKKSKETSEAPSLNKKKHFKQNERPLKQLLKVIR